MRNGRRSWLVVMGVLLTVLSVPATAAYADAILELRLVGYDSGLGQYRYSIDPVTGAMTGNYLDVTATNSYLYRVMARIVPGTSNNVTGGTAFVSTREVENPLLTGSGINTVRFDLAQSDDTSVAPIQVRFSSVGSLQSGFSGGSLANVGTLVGNDIKYVQASQASNVYVGYNASAPRSSDWVVLYDGSFTVNSIAGTNSRLYFDGGGFTASTYSNSDNNGGVALRSWTKNSSGVLAQTNYTVNKGENGYHDVAADFGQRLATADNSGSFTAFGQPIIYNTPTGATTTFTSLTRDSSFYGGILSTVAHSAGTSGQAMIGTTAKFLALRPLGTSTIFTNSSYNSSGSDSAAWMAWRNRTTSETFLASDVVQVSHMANDGSLWGGTTDKYVIQLDINSGLTLNSAWWTGDNASNPLLYLAYRTGSEVARAVSSAGGTDTESDWVRAGSTFVRNGAYDPALDFTVGKWGIDTANRKAWAVVNYNADFAVKYPSTPSVVDTTYSLTLNSLSGNAVFANEGSVTVNSKITNTGTAPSADTITFTGLGLLVNGSGSGDLSGEVASGGPLTAPTGSHTANMTFSPTAAGTFTLTAKATSVTPGSTSATLDPAADSVVVTAYLHASPKMNGSATITSATLALPDVIVGYTGPIAGTGTVTLGNLNSSIYRVNLQTAGATTSGNVSLAGAGLGSLAQGGTGTVTASLATGQVAGSFSVPFSLTYQDDTTGIPGLVGSTNLGTATITVSGNVLGHASPSLSASGNTPFTVITGGTIPGYNFNLQNAAGNLAKLEITSLGGTSGALVGDRVDPGSFVALSTPSSTAGAPNPSYSQGYTVGVSDQQNLSGWTSLTSQTYTVTGTILDHADGSLSVYDVNFGKRLGRSGGLTVSTILQNATGSRADLEVVTTNGLTGALAGDKLAPGPTGNKTLSATFNSPGVVDSFFDVFVTDDQSLPGHYNTTTEATQLTFNVDGAYAAAEAVAQTFVTGNELSSGALGANADLAGLYSVVQTVGAVGTQATIRYGTLVEGGEVTMNWRRYNDADRLQRVISDVVELNGVGTNLYVLEMTYNDLDEFVAGNELALANGGSIHIAWLNGLVWENAILGNDGGLTSLLPTTVTNSAGIDGWQSSYTGLGQWGVDVYHNKVWAVLNHNSSFAVVPEPATLAFLVIGGLTMAGAGVMRKRRQS